MAQDTSDDDAKAPFFGRTPNDVERAAHRTTEETLRRTSDFLRATLESIGDAFYAVDRAWRFTYVNPAAARLIRRPADELLGVRLWEAVPIQPEIRERLETAARGGERLRYEFRSRFYRRWFEVDAYPSASGVSIYMRDVDERHRNEERIRLLETCVARSGVLVLVTEEVADLGARVVYANEAFTRAAGYALDQLIGAPPPAPFRSVERQREDLFLARRDGSGVWLDLERTPLHDRHGRVTHRLFVARDITERRLAEERIHDQAALLDAARDAILELDLEGRIAYWNRSAAELYGWAAAEVMGRAYSEVVGVDTREVKRALAATGAWSGESRHLTRDGRTRDVEGRWTLVHTNGGVPRSVLVINTDITERKRLEAQFLRSQRMESLGTLAGGIAHDLNNVLAPVLVALTLLRKEQADAETDRLLDTIERNTRRGADLVRQVLAFARGVEGQRVPVDVGRVVGEVAQLMGETLPRHIRIDVALPGDAWVVTGDATQLQQVVTNLCINARDAMPDGGLLAVSVMNAQLERGADGLEPGARAGPYVVVAVRDEGVGMHAAVLARAFEPFFTTKPVGQGTGLGLSTAQAIVRSHGGWLAAESEVGRGSSFRVFLPAEPGRAAVAPPVEPAGALNGKGELVLVVDDEPSIREVTERMLCAFGYRVVVAADGAEALAIFRERADEFELVLTDMMMPTMDGPALVGALRALRPEVRVVGVSGLQAAGTGSKLGVQRFLAKPFTAPELLRALREALA